MSGDRGFGERKIAQNTLPYSPHNPYLIADDFEDALACFETYLNWLNTQADYEPRIETALFYAVRALGALRPEGRQ